MTINARDKTIEDLGDEIAAHYINIQSLEQKVALMEGERKQTYESLTDTEVMKEKLQKALELEQDTTKSLRAQLNDLSTNSTTAYE